MPSPRAAHNQCMTKSRQLPIYALVSSSDRRSSPQLRQSTADCTSPLAVPRSGTVDPHRLCGFTQIGAGLLAGQRVTMEQVAGVLAQFPDVGRIVLIGPGSLAPSISISSFRLRFRRRQILTRRPAGIQRTIPDPHFSPLYRSSSGSNYGNY